MRKRAWIGWIVGLALAGLALAASAPLFIQVKDGDPVVSHAGEAKARLHNIQLALERYAVDHDSKYPVELAVLEKEEYLAELPPNPYDRVPQRLPMPEVPLGEHAPGGVTYVPAYGLSAGTAAHYCTGYTLLVYGDAAARRRGLTRRKIDPRTQLSDALKVMVAWDYVLLSLHQAQTGGGSLSNLPGP